ncbi:hypothetical protein AT4G09035, partial [Arabidopsis thaliana]
NKEATNTNPAKDPAARVAALLLSTGVDPVGPATGAPSGVREVGGAGGEAEEGSGEPAGGETGAAVGVADGVGVGVGELVRRFLEVEQEMEEEILLELVLELELWLMKL